MLTVAITGHVNLSEETASWVVDALRRRLAELMGSRVHGITCLARGTDQLFARVVLGLSGTFDVVLPCRDYPDEMVAEGAGEEFLELLGQASDVATMPYESSSREAYFAASDAMLRRCDLLLAAWDGRPSASVGDTAHVVETARRRRLPVEVLWPPAAKSVARGG